MKRDGKSKFILNSEAEHIHGKFRKNELRELRNTVLKSQKFYRELSANGKLGKMASNLGVKVKTIDPAIAGAYNSTNGMISIRTNEVNCTSEITFDASIPNKFDQVDRVNKMNAAKRAYKSGKSFDLSQEDLGTSLYTPNEIAGYDFTKGAGSHAEVHAGYDVMNTEGSYAQKGDIAIYVNKAKGNRINPFYTCPDCHVLLKDFHVISNVEGSVNASSAKGFVDSGYNVFENLDDF